MGARVFLYLIAIFVVFAAPVLALGSSASVSVTSEKDAVYPGDCNKYVANVTNLDGAQRIDFRVEGDALSWISLTSAFADFKPGETKAVIYYLCPVVGTGAGTYKFVFEATSRADNSTTEKTVPIYVLERPYLEIRDVVFGKDLYKIGEPVDVTVNIKNLGAADAKNTHLIIEISGANAPEKIRADVPVIETARGAPVSESVGFDRYLAHGEYEFAAKVVDDIGDVLAQKSAKVRIEEKSELKQETNVEGGILSRAVILTGTNSGNKAGTIELKSTGAGYLVLYSFDRQPEKITYSGANKVFTWTCNLGPAESCVVRYQVDYWLVVIAVVVVFGIAYVIYNVSEQPHIHKHIIRKDKEHAVHIVIRNRSRHTLQNIQIIDDVPEVVSIVAGSLSPAIKPVAKSKRGGVELTWTFAKLSPGEERVVSYRIRPVVMVLGRIHLPKARIYAVNAGGKKYSANSAVVVE